MGYSGRYHAASLAAVFVALAIGILIGASLGSDLISGAADDLEKSLGSDLEDSRSKVAELESELEQERDFEGQIYPLLVNRRLSGQTVAVVALGDLPPDLNDAVQGALDPSGARVGEVAVVREPPPTADLIGGHRGNGSTANRRRVALRSVARRAARALTGGGGFEAVRGDLLSRFSGEPRSIDAVVIARSRPEGLSGREERDVTTLEDSLIGGFRAAGVPAVGVERSDEAGSSIDYFEAQGLPTVDNADQFAGKVALVATLAGAEGNFGVKDSADSLLPDLLRLPRPAGSGSR